MYSIVLSDKNYICKRCNTSYSLNCATPRVYGEQSGPKPLDSKDKTIADGLNNTCGGENRTMARYVLLRSEHIMMTMLST